VCNEETLVESKKRLPINTYAEIRSGLTSGFRRETLVDLRFGLQFGEQVTILVRNVTTKNEIEAQAKPA
jgi:hypothetical protein